MENSIRDIFELQKLVQSKNGPVLASFTKKDGSERLMLCTLDFNRIPSEHIPKANGASEEQNRIKLQTSKMLPVFDIEQQGWRVVNFKTLHWVKMFDGTVYKPYAIKTVQEVKIQ